MKPSSIAAVVVAAALGFAAARWLNTGDTQTRRTPNGQVDMSAPAPRVNGRPDLSGIWEAERTPTTEFVRVLGPGLPDIQPDLNEITKHVIYMDGRTLPDNPEPSWMGTSAGQWQDDTLIVETTGFQERAWLDGFGHPRSETMRITERFHRRDFGHMDLEMTFDDPKYYTRAFGFKTT